MVPVLTFAAKIATDIGVVTLVGGGTKLLTGSCSLNAIQKIGIGCAEIVLAGMVIDKANVYIEEQFDTFDEYLKKRKESNSWTTGGRTDSHGI